MTGASGGQGEAPPPPAPLPLKGFALKNPGSAHFMRGVGF